MIPPLFLAAIEWLIERKWRPEDQPFETRPVDMVRFADGEVGPWHDDWRIADTIAGHDYAYDVPRRRWTRGGWVPLDP